MTPDELDALLSAESVAKANTANLGVLMARNQHAATTVSATMELAASSGVRVFATGGLGGVHPGLGQRLDISSDLAAFTRFPVAVVTSGVKSILDVESTREALETLGVPVVGYRTDAFPAFYLRDSDADVDARFDDLDELASFVSAELTRTGRGVVVANPIPEASEIDPRDWADWLARAERAADEQGAAGRGRTPALLAALHDLSGSRTLEANLALDSVSNNNDGGNGLPGDAFTPYEGDNVQDFVVDLTPFTTSKGVEFGIAPLVKTSKTSSSFFGSLGSAQAISQDLLSGVNYPAASYALWTTPGQGVHPTNNDAANLINPPAATGNQFAVAMNEFSTNNGGGNHEGVVGAIVNYDTSEPGRLYVRRVMAATTGVDLNQGNAAAFGGVSVDAHGNTYFRADNFGIAPPAGVVPVSGNNWFRTRMQDRADAASNLVSGLSTTFDATDALLTGSGDVHSPPSHVAASAFGGNGAVSGPNFSSQWVRGATSSLTSDLSHFPAGSSDQRGTIGSSAKTVLDSGIWTHAQMHQDAGGATNRIAVWSVDASLSVVESYGFALPASITDPCDSITINTSVSEFRGYLSQGAFRGGTGMMAVGSDQAGRVLAAGNISELNITADPLSHIAVLRFNEDGTGAEWSLAGWAAPLSGKPICDETGAAIGQMTLQVNVSGLLGPSSSVPTIDSAGNVWFLAAVELFNRIDSDMDTIGDTSDFDTALLRAVYDPDNFCYTLELVVELGQVFTGQNSGLDYQIQFLEIADSNSMSSGAFFSANGASGAWNGFDVSDLDTSDPRTNGGIVIKASIVYDVDADGDFENPTAGGGNAASIDEQYNALLYVGNLDNTEPPSGGCNVADLAEPFGTLDFSDVIAFLTAFGSMDPAADLAAPFGTFDFSDVIAFLGAFGAGCP
eukprot:g5776.t1